MISMNERSSQVIQEIYPLIAGLGMGLLFRSPFVAVEAAMHDQDRAGSTGNFFLVRFIGSCTGLVSIPFIYFIFISTKRITPHSPSQGPYFKVRSLATYHWAFP